MKTDEEIRAMLGKRVTVTLTDASSDEKVITTGELLAFGQGGDFEILEDGGFIHYCWPMLEISEIPVA